MEGMVLACGVASDKLPCTETDEVMSIAVQTFAAGGDIFLTRLSAMIVFPAASSR
jgi:hypothetical protein